MVSIISIATVSLTVVNIEPRCLVTLTVIAVHVVFQKNIEFDSAPNYVSFGEVLCSDNTIDVLSAIVFKTGMIWFGIDVVCVHQIV